MLNKVVIASAILLCVGGLSAATECEPFRWFDDAKLGMFIHWGLYSVPARGEWVMKKEGFSPAEYAKFADAFRPPADFSPEQWVLLAKRMGAKYAVLTTRHHDGYALWNTKTTDFNSFKTCGRDFVREFADACRRHGIRVGFYYSILNWQYRPRPDGTYDPAVWDAYLKCLHGALRELMTGGHLSGAALDVFEVEPLPPEDALWDCPRLLITPHCSGNMTLGYTVDRIVALFLEDFENYCAGKPLERLVDLQLGY